MKKKFDLSSIVKKMSKKNFTILLYSLIAVVFVIIIALVAGNGCHKHSYPSKWEYDLSGHWKIATCHKDEKKFGAHEWKVTDKLDANGESVYVCSVCGYVHQHTYDATKLESNGRAHWHPVTCGHIAAAVEEEHFFDEGTGLCTACGFEEANVIPYELAFAYTLVDENGNPVADESGNYTETGVTYTCLTEDSTYPADTAISNIVYEGDIIRFRVNKSVFSYFTDGADKPLVEVISGKGTDKKTVETIYPNENGVYTLSVQGNTIVSVANVMMNKGTVQGKGTQEEPFTINSEIDWLYFAMFVNDKSYYSIDYNIAYWKLTKDLDFGGESIYVVGDGFSSLNSVFCGNFDGGGHTISNFVLENNLSSAVGEGYSNYLGLFGVVTGYVGVDAVIANLTVENATVNATAGDDDMVVAGVILGYGAGANVMNCTVRNCQINVKADDMYMSFAGGVVGYLQSGMTEDGMLFYASISYSVAENITIKGSGMLYSAGGIAGRVTSYNNQVTAFVYNCYSSGNVSDAVRAGGVVGELQRYSSLQNSYSTASVSSFSTFKTEVEDKYKDTLYDDRYAYAGGILAYAENDTVVEGCFFDGSVYATALAGKNYAKQSRIVAGWSKAQFADYYANEVVLNNQPDGTKVSAKYLKNQFGWSEADWVFKGKYPTINQKEVARTFKVTVNIDGKNEHVCTIESQYLPLSYRYILTGNENSELLPYYTNGTKRTYGYYFDSDLTKPVPNGYVPMKDMTVYAKYADTSEIAGEYYLSNGNVSATLKLAGDGTYEYEEGAILLKGEYAFNGEIVTFQNAVFARLAANATQTQKESYYTFWAKLQSNGDLYLFDCDKVYEVTADDEAQNPNFTAMARFYATDNPMKMISGDNLSFTGGYYYVDENTKNVFEFNSDYTGAYKKYNGDNVFTDSFTFTQEGTSLVISLDRNGATFVVSVQDSKPVSVKDNRGETYDLSQIDAFAGTWEKSATSHKIYTFDGMGNWTYEHYVYLVENNAMAANKQVVTKDKGEYTVTDGKLSLKRGDVKVEATLSDGVVSVTEDGQPMQVEFTNLNGYKGVWYTANNKVIRYTLKLDGVNGKGVGTATLSGFQAEPLSLRYTAVSSNTLYLYVENVVYATLQYSEATGLFNGMFYDNVTGKPTTPQTLYLYDDFMGIWVSDIKEIPTISFNGFGGYNTTDDSGYFLAVKGMATIGKNTVEYTIDRETGNAKFSYGGVKYVLSYNEYSNDVAVTYDGKKGTVAKADIYADATLYNDTNSFTFDGRGNFEQGGIVVSDGKMGNYKIQENGDITLAFEGQTKTITVEKKDGVITGYSLNGETLYIDNIFFGGWAVPEENISITVGNIPCMPAKGQTIELQGSYNGNPVTMYYDGSDTITFAYNGKQYSMVNTLGGRVSAIILKESVTIGEETATERIIVKQDDVFGVWTRTDKEKYTLTFDGCGGSPYLSGGKVSDRQGNVTRSRTYKIVDGVVTIYEGNTNQVYATFEECDKNAEGAYVNGDRYYQLKIA